MKSNPEGRRLVFNGKQQVSLETFSPGEPGPNQIRVCTVLSLMSTGTENIVFNRAFDAGTHWDAWVKYPFHPGYSAVGLVESVGTQVKGYQVGDRVACRVSHSSHACVDVSLACPIPAQVSWEEAAWFALGKIAFHGALAGGFSLGDRILIIGAGPIGQMALRWAVAAGAQAVIVVDPLEERLALARAGGATATISSPISAARDAVWNACAGGLPRVVVDTTGNASVFNEALGLAADFGRVVVLGDTGSPTRQSLSLDVITRGLTIVGAHDVHMNATWNNRSIAQLFFSLAGRGRFHLGGLTSHRFSPEQCAEAYAVANRERQKTMGILFNWSAA